MGCKGSDVRIISPRPKNRRDRQRKSPVPFPLQNLLANSKVQAGNIRIFPFLLLNPNPSKRRKPTMFKSTLKPAIAVIGVSSMLLLSACNKGDTGPVAATVNGIPISQSTLEMFLQQRTMQGRPDTPEARKEIVDQLAAPILASQEALKKGLDKKPETASQLQLVRQNILAHAFVEDYMKNHPVSDQQLQEAYDKYKAENSGNEYKARHILVAKESDAKDIIAQLKKNPKA